MDRDGAFEGLTSSSPHERLKAARVLSRYAEPSDLGQLRRFRQRELVAYVRKALDLAIAKAERLTPAAPPDEGLDLEIPPEIRRELRAKAVEEVTTTILHEIAGPVGLARLAASEEISGYEGSKTKVALDRVGRIFDAVRQLKRAATAPRYELFDLAEVVSELISEYSEEVRRIISPQGPQPCNIKTDRRLITLALGNGLRNAVEAVSGPDAGERQSVVVIWGITDIDCWIAVIDSGPGLVVSPEQLLRFGSTTKPDHEGCGLAVSHQAMESLSGEITLENNAQGGARFELRWERL